MKIKRNRFLGKKANFEKHGCQNSVTMVNVDVQVTMTLKYFQIFFWWT